MSAFSGKEFLSLPEELAQIYEVVSCLKYAEQTATYLLREKNGDRLYLLKTASDPVFAELLANEKNILEFIRRQDSPLTASFPAPVFLKTYGGSGAPEHPDDCDKSDTANASGGALSASDSRNESDAADVSGGALSASGSRNENDTADASGGALSTSGSRNESDTADASGGAFSSSDGFCDRTTYYIRTYIKGKTLEELCETAYKRPGLTPARALDYVIALTELLQFLHSLNPPLIHRDIKPQNVVVDAEGGCHFIDLGISRFYRFSKRGDTFVMGTKLTAPPEQFGYQQTDMRSDLYSMGILLLYCMTGEYKAEEQSLAELPAPVQYIIKKATMFDPDKRYQSAGELLPDLLHARYPDAARTVGGVSRRRLVLYCAVLAALAVLNLGLAGMLLRERRTAVVEKDAVESVSATGNTNEQTDRPVGSDADTDRSAGTPDPSAAAKDAAYTFREPMIEEAVRLQLNIPEGPITETDLLKVTELHIFGLQIYSDDSEIWFRGEFPWIYNNETRETGLYLQQGPIKSLEDITHMPNLRVLSLYKQQISDISVLEGTQIEELGLGYNPLTNLEPLRGNDSIRYLNLAQLEITDASVLASLTNLSELNISATGVTSVAGLENCRIRTLNLYHTELDDYTELHALTELKTLSTYTVTPELLALLDGLPLTEFEISYSSGILLSDFSVFPELETLRFCGDHNSVLLLDEPELPKLKTLDLRDVTVSDFSGLSSLSELETLLIYSTVCESYDGLDVLPKLTYFICTEEQQKQIKAQYPEKSYVYSY